METRTTGKEPRGHEGGVEGAGQPLGTLARRFDAPDETNTFQHGRVDKVRLDGRTLARITLEPGWRWTRDMKELDGTELCEKPHLGFMMSGRLRVEMRDGSVLEIGPGECATVGPGHDAEVSGNEPAVWIEFSETAEGYAAGAGREAA